MSLIIMGMNRGETARAPRLTKRLCWSSKVCIPPMPDPMMTPARNESFKSPTPACSIASTEAAMANWTKRSALRASFGIHANVGIKPLELRGEGGLEAIQVHALDGGHAVGAGDQGVPARFSIQPDSGQHSHAGYDDSGSGHDSTSRLHRRAGRPDRFHNHIPGSTTTIGWNRATCSGPDRVLPALIWISVSRGATPDSRSHPGPYAVSPDPLQGS